MRPLTEKETQIFFEKLARFIGNEVQTLLERNGEAWTFRLHRLRVYYMRDSMANSLPTFACKLLMSAGICMGKFTKSGRFFVQVTALPVLAPLAQYKVRLKTSAELSFLYGQHVLNEGIESMTEGTPKNAGVVVVNMDDLPIGLGVAVQSSVSRRLAAPLIMVVARQADIGEYLRSEHSIA